LGEWGQDVVGVLSAAYLAVLAHLTNRVLCKNSWIRYRCFSTPNQCNKPHKTFSDHIFDKLLTAPGRQATKTVECHAPDGRQHDFKILVRFTLSRARLDCGCACDHGWSPIAKDRPSPGRS